MCQGLKNSSWHSRKPWRLSGGKMDYLFLSMLRWFIPFHHPCTVLNASVQCWDVMERFWSTSSWLEHKTTNLQFTFFPFLFAFSFWNALWLTVSFGQVVWHWYGHFHWLNNISLHVWPKILWDNLNTHSVFSRDTGYYDRINALQQYCTECWSNIKLFES